MTPLANQPAFPASDRQGFMFGTGLTIRQHYAGLAMQGILASPLHYNTLADVSEAENTTVQQACASIALQYADALIAKLEESK